MKKIRLGLVDDHHLFSKSLSMLLQSFPGFSVDMEASNGRDLQQKLAGRKEVPEIMLIDVAMPLMDGIETAQWLRRTHQHIKMVALSMDDKESTIISMLRAGCCGYLLKDTHPEELERALNEVYIKGFYNSDASMIGYRKILEAGEPHPEVNLSDKEAEFILLACSDLTYKEIAQQMGNSERTVDGYRESVFRKFHVQSRVGMALEAIRRGMIDLSQPLR